MCVGAPKAPKVSNPPERQAIKLPTDAQPDLEDDLSRNRRRRAVMAGLITSPQGVLGAPSVAKPTLG